MTEQLSYKFLDKKRLLILADKNTTHKSFLQYLKSSILKRKLEIDIS